jgi:hypothetical protein
MEDMGDMEDELVKLDGDTVVVKVIAKQVQVDGVHTLDYFYNVLLQDILQVVNVHESIYGNRKRYSLCPRWQQRNPERRDVRISIKGDLLNPDEDIPLGTITITNNPLENRYEFNQAHIFEYVFRLSFMNNQNEAFITPEEFYDLYNRVMQ